MNKAYSSSIIKLLSFVIALAVLIGGAYLYHEDGLISEAHAINSVAAAPHNQISQSLVALPNFADIVANQGPAVVNISIHGTVKAALNNFNRIPQLNPDDPFYDFFRHFQAPTPEEESPIQGLGSGFIISNDGVILTNAHVVADADEVTVKLTDKREYKAKVLGLDKPSDVAVLKIEAKNLPTVKVGDPKNSRVGEWVVAIGAPFGFENSVTAGIISAKSRTLPDDTYVPFLQTDVAINPGNSGGPLFNLNGEVIGINSQIYSQSGGYQGLSFAIPIDVAMKVEHQLIDHGKVSRGRLGVTIQAVSQELADSFGLDGAKGALVSSVEKGSPAEKSGIEPGDVILKFNGVSINRSEDLPPLVADFNPGSLAKIEVWHGRKLTEIGVRVAEIKNSVATTESSTVPSNNKLGLVVRPLSEDEKTEVNVSHGLIVERVNKGPAAKAGIHSGDIILAVNGTKVTTAEQLLSIIENNQRNVALLIIRGNNKLFVPINMG